MRTWLDVARQFAASRGIDDALVAVLECFAGPQPRGGPPAPPEVPWAEDFASLERDHLADTFDDVARTLHPEVDRDQAEIFARRLQAVDAAIAALNDDVGRLLRVGLRHRVRGILGAPTARPTRIRALADFYFSYVGLHRHRRAGAGGPTLEQRAARAGWTPVVPGLAHARLEGDSDMGPLHVNLLRVDPERITLRVEDCRPSVERAEPFARHVAARGAIAGVSGGFFLYSEPDIVTPSRRFDPVGLLVDEGEVRSPPCFARGSLLVDAEGRVDIDRVGMMQVEIETPDGRGWRPEAIVNRAQASHGPPSPSAAVVGHEVLAVGTSLPVPLNGFVLPLPEAGMLRAGDRLRYRAVHGPRGRVHAGIAGGPLLLCDGRPVLDMRGEDFWGTAPPVTFSQDETGDRNLLPRLGAGLTDDGTLLLAAVDGRNFERALGMTLAGVGRLLASLGATRATNLDGGSSKRMVLQGRALDLATTEIVAQDHGGTPVRPVHTAVLLQPR